MAAAPTAIGHKALRLIGIGFLCFGIGEWINRPIVQQPYAGGENRIAPAFEYRRAVSA
ncbi:MAG: hypothetical protein JWQ89_2232 [Devosia sp.]|uniref:hypothetical protein n=1 Tax=Devosia sp. TaxID=1871048 RepID=UPI0026260421|nr:hypothetical protein [Devosia sp.]MDB5540505.1 hypothetical protein [Devosia sp.]